MTRSHWFRAGMCAVVLSLIVGVVNTSGSASAEEPGPHPGLPPLRPPPTWPDGATLPVGGAWFGSLQNGISGARPAKQWARIPLTMLAVNQIGLINFLPPPRPFPDGTHLADEILGGLVYFVSPEGSSRNYGETPPIRVRTVAFGSIPVEATLQISQRTGPDGLPIGFWAGPSKTDTYAIGRNALQGKRFTFGASAFGDQVAVKITDIKVDGVDVGLRSTCATPYTAALSVTSVATEIIAPRGKIIYDVYDSRGFASPYGGRLSGTIDIPAFKDCTTATGDDISPLLTAAVSGDGNPLEIGASLQACPVPAPGATDPIKAGCPEWPDGHYPGNPDLPLVPKELEFPDHAP